jgi:multisubunit Na+/H+ antiporter MnhG subunit
MRFLVYRRCVGATIGQTIGGIVAFAALSMVITIATIRATLGLSNAWHRTNKFRERRNWRRALAAARTETITAGACIVAGAGLFVLAPHHGGVVVMLGIALVGKGLTFLTSPLLALVANKALVDPSSEPARTRQPDDRFANSAA